MRIAYFSIAAAILALAVGGFLLVGLSCFSAGSAYCIVQTVTGTRPDLDVPYVATRQDIVRTMIAFADVKPGDRVIDLGTGDGRILIAAAQSGATGLGVDIDPAMIRQARAEARRAGVADRVDFRVEDLFKTRLQGADVVTLYLLQEINIQLRPRLLSELRPGARVVSHAFDMGEWRPDREGRAGGARVYLWIVPAKLAGTWSLTEHGGRVRQLRLSQDFQRVRGTIGGQPIGDVRLQGDRLRFTIGTDDQARVYEGIVHGDRIEAAQASSGATNRTTTWRATRVDGPAV